MTIKVPEPEDLNPHSPRGEQDELMPVAFSGRGGDESPRDPSKPIYNDANGNLFYAPPGITFTIGR